MTHRICLMLTAALFFTVACATTEETAHDKVNVAAEPGRFSIPLDQGDSAEPGEPLAMWRVRSHGRDIILAALTHGTDETNACRPKLIQALRSSDVYYESPTDFLLQNFSLHDLPRENLEDDATFQARVEKEGLSKKALEKWQAFLEVQRAEVQALRKKLAQFPEERRAEIMALGAEFALSLQYSVVKLNRGRWPAWDDCIENVAGDFPIPQSLVLDEALKNALLPVYLESADAKAMANWTVGVLESGPESSAKPHARLGMWMSQPPFDFRAAEALTSFEPSAERQLLTDGILALALNPKTHPDKALFFALDGSDLQGSVGILEALAKAGVEIHQLSTKSKLPEAPPAAQKPLQAMEMQPQDQTVHIKELPSEMLWELPPGEPATLRRMTSNLFSYSVPSSKETPKELKFTTFRIREGGLEKMDLPDEAWVISTQNNVGIVKVKDQFSALDILSGSLTPLEGNTRLILRGEEDPWFLTRQEPTEGQKSAQYWVRFAAAGTPLLVEGVVVESWDRFPTTLNLNGQMVLDLRSDEPREGCQLMGLSLNKTHCLANTEAEAQAVLHEHDKVSVYPAPKPRPRGQRRAPVELQFADDHRLGRRIALLSSNWSDVGASSRLSTGVLSRRMRTADGLPKLYASETLWTLPGVLGCRAYSTRSEKPVIWCDWQADEKAPRRYGLLSAEKGTLQWVPSWLPPDFKYLGMKSNKDTDDVLLLRDQEVVRLKGLPACELGWRKSMQSGEWVHLNCSSKKGVSLAGGVLHLTTARYFPAPAGTHVVSLDRDGNVVLSDAEVGERRSTVSRLWSAVLK